MVFPKMSVMSLMNSLARVDWGDLWRPKMIPLFIAKSQCYIVMYIFDWYVLAHEIASVMDVVCMNSASGRMDHTKVVDATMQE